MAEQDYVVNSVLHRGESIQSALHTAKQAKEAARRLILNIFNLCHKLAPGSGLSTERSRTFWPEHGKVSYLLA